MSMKVTLTKDLGMKQENNHKILILIELWRKTKQWHKKYEKCQFCRCHKNEEPEVTRSTQKNPEVTRNNQ